MGFLLWLAKFLLMVAMTGNRDVLLSLYKDMESCREYEDIQVMWAMIHSSCPQNSRNTRMNKRPFYWRFCFRPTWIVSFCSNEERFHLPFLVFSSSLDWSRFSPLWEGKIALLSCNYQEISKDWSLSWVFSVPINRKVFISTSNKYVCKLL